MKVNEIFYSLQGEGRYTGTPAVFIRLSGCNLHCPFCDTQHQTGNEMSENQIIDEVEKYKSMMIVLTGGEPTIYNLSSLISKLHAKDKFIAMETNGTNEIPFGIDWVTVSPKHTFVGDKGIPKVTRANELKLVYDGNHVPDTYGIEADYYYLQPCDTGDEKENEKIIQSCIDYIKSNPKWNLSLQTQKILKVR